LLVVVLVAFSVAIVDMSQAPFVTFCLVIALFRIFV